MDYSEIKERKLDKKINEEVDFPLYLSSIGYKLDGDKTSAGHYVFKKDHVEICINRKRDPMTFFVRHTDIKGLFLKYLMEVEKLPFKRAIEKGLNLINRSYEIDNIKNVELLKKSKGKGKSLEENYNIVHLSNSRHLTEDRFISKETLNSPYLKGRIFNAFHIKDNGGKIPNVAFPKYDTNGVKKNYVLYNKPYSDKNTGKIKKFRLVLNDKDSYLFYTNPNIGKIDTIYFAEDGKDLVSHIELNNPKNAWYFSFAGNVYDGKLEQFTANILPKIAVNPNIKIHSITDNDIAGFSFDLSVYTHLASELNKNVMFSLERDRNAGAVVVLYKDNSNIDKEFSFIKQNLKGSSINVIQFKDKIKFEYTIQNSKEDNSIPQDNIKMLNLINSIYLPIKEAKLDKSVGKDWNDDLMFIKKNINKYLTVFKFNDVEPGDTIELKLEKGPEGKSNKGIVLQRRKNDYIVDFGLEKNYLIKFDQINILNKSHKKETDQNVSQKKNNQLKI